MAEPGIPELNFMPNESEVAPALTENVKTFPKFKREPIVAAPRESNRSLTRTPEYWLGQIQALSSLEYEGCLTPAKAMKKLRRILSTMHVWDRTK